MIELAQTKDLRDTYRNHAVGCEDPYDHPGSCRDPYLRRDLPLQYYSRMGYQASDRHAFRPIHIHQPDAEQPYSADWLMYCGREINHNRLVTQERQFAGRDWADVAFCIGCVTAAQRAGHPEAAEYIR